MTDAVLAGFAVDFTTAETDDFNFFGADFDLDLSAGFVSLALGLPDKALTAPLLAFSFALTDFLDSLGADADLFSFDPAF